ncbi:MAG: Spy/CpxP family protein refolding chaperone [Cellvibrionaceae bacterium]
MKRSTKIITIATLTLGLIGGAFAYGKHKFRDPAAVAEHVMEHISDELQLDNSQQQALVTLKDTVLENRAKMRAQMNPFSDEVIAMISAERFDQDKALELINAKTQAINTSAPELANAFGSFLDSLNAEQKGEVVAFIKHKIEHKRSHHQYR